jgi:restriction system protein
MQKLTPEDFGLTLEEYNKVVAERNAPQPTHIIDKILGWSSPIIMLLPWAVIVWIATRNSDRETSNVVSIIACSFMPSVLIGCCTYLFLGMIFEKIFKINRNVDLNPLHHKAVLYERAIEQYELRCEQYWKSLKGVKFEKALARLYTDMGYSVHQTKGSGDEGIDLVLYKDSKKIIVQCKGHEKPIGVGVIRDLYGTMMHSGAESSVLACPIGFTEGVRKFAKGKPMELLAAKELVEMAERAQKKPV